MQMDSQIPPFKIPRLADSRTRPETCWNMERMSPPLGLGLELGRGGGGSSHHSTPITSYTKSYGFTILQLQELKIQSFIYKYIEAGLPVPYNLILPIWNSVVGSLGGLNSSLYQLYPRLMGCSPSYLEYKNGMDPEPGRCRRTDGKKWRCGKESLPDQKYCERHIHRGRYRSRKLVEAASSQSTTTASTRLSISLPYSSASSTNFSPKSVLCRNAQKN